MPLYIEYLLKTAVCLAFIYLFYIVLLKRMTHYSWNRWFLLSSSVLSFLIPLINLNSIVHPDSIQVITFLDQVPTIPARNFDSNTAINSTLFDQWTWLNLIFFIGVLVLLIRLMIQLLSLKILTSRSTLLKDGEVKFYHLPGKNLPFSFLNHIYLNKEQYSESELNDIVQHEMVHVIQKHTVDRILIEFVCIMNWFNPFSWLIKKAICENLEFIADDEVIRSGVNKKSYQYLLIKVTGANVSGITNYLNFSSMKSRIKMMNKARSKKGHLFKFILWIPIILLLLLAFRDKNEKNDFVLEVKDSAIKSFTLSSLTYAVADSKVETIVKKGQDKSWLQVGKAFDLSLISYEKQRLQDLLKKNGYNAVQNQAITFLIDTSSRNNFSVQVNINVSQPKASQYKIIHAQPGKSFHPVMNNQEFTSNNYGKKDPITKLSLSDLDGNYSNSLAINRGSNVSVE